MRPARFLWALFPGVCLFTDPWSQIPPSGAGMPTPGEASPPAIEVRTGDYYYEPSQITIPPGLVTVNLTNAGPRRHTFNVTDLSDDRHLVRSPRVVAGDTVAINFVVPEEGAYRIYCSEPGHADQGHIGLLIVQRAPAPAVAEAQGRSSGPPREEPTVPRALTLWSLWVHVPLVTAWIGLVMFDVLAAMAPGLEAAQRGRMIAWSRPLVVPAILVIIATGIWQTLDNPFRPVSSWSTLIELREATTYGLALFWKHGFVLATFGLTVLVRLLLAPRMATDAVATQGMAVARTLRLERWVRWLSLLNLGACLGALVFATRMVWELH